MSEEIVMAGLQALAGLFLTITMAVSAWTVKQVVRLTAELAALRAKHEAVDTRIDEARGWMSSIDKKLDRVIEGK